MQTKVGIWYLLARIRGKRLVKISVLQWLGIGIIVTFLSSAITFVPNVPEPWAPMPIYLAFLIWVVGPGALAVFPSLSVLFWWLVSRYSHRFSFAQLILNSAVFSFNLGWLYVSYDYGTRYQGETHTILVVVVNVSLFLLLIASSWIAWQRQSEILTRVNSLGLLVLLSYCAFPYLGEMP